MSNSAGYRTRFGGWGNTTLFICAGDGEGIPHEGIRHCARHARHVGTRMADRLAAAFCRGLPKGASGASSEAVMTLGLVGFGCSRT